MKIYNSSNIFKLLLDEINTGTSISFTIHGNSMFPTILDGTNISIKRSMQYKVGDIIAYYVKDKNEYLIVVHRIVEMHSEYILAKGDNNDRLDPLKIPINNILGLVSF